MASDLGDGNYLGAYRRFFVDFLDKVNPDDQLPIKTSGHDVTENEIVGEIIHMTLQYLDQQLCPPSLQCYIVRLVIEEIKATCRKEPENCGFRQEEKTYAPLKLMQAVTGKVNEICQRYLENSRLALLPPPPSSPMPLASAFAIRNSRRKMEDRHVVLHDLNTIFNIKDEYIASYYAVFDGHGGYQAAVFCAVHLHQYLAESRYYPTDPERALRDAFITTDAAFVQKSARQTQSSGTTAVCALILNRKLYLAWAGDSQAALAKQGLVNQLVNPHKPDREDERQRVKKMGGTVMHLGVWRVNGNLAVSRAIGDAQYKPYVTGDPEIRCITLDGQEDFLIIACDGLWDCVDEYEAASVVYGHVCNYPSDYGSVSQHLVDHAKQRGSFDNITVIVVFLTPPSQIALRPAHGNKLLANVQLGNMNPENRLMSNANGQFDVNSPFTKQTNANNGSHDLMDEDEESYGTYGNKSSSNGKRHENGGNVTTGEGVPDYDADEDDEDLGPETDVDAVDDASEPATTLADVSRELFPEKSDTRELYQTDERIDDDSPPSPRAMKSNQQALIPDADNVADSEDSEDEWNYYRIDPNKRKTSAETEGFDRESREQEKPSDANQEGDETWEIIYRNFTADKGNIKESDKDIHDIVAPVSPDVVENAVEFEKEVAGATRNDETDSSSESDSEREVRPSALVDTEISADNKVDLLSTLTSSTDYIEEKKESQQELQHFEEQLDLQHLQEQQELQNLQKEEEFKYLQEQEELQHFEEQQELQHLPEKQEELQHLPEEQEVLHLQEEHQELQHLQEQQELQHPQEEQELQHLQEQQELQHSQETQELQHLHEEEQELQHLPEEQELQQLPEQQELQHLNEEQQQQDQEVLEQKEEIEHKDLEAEVEEDMDFQLNPNAAEFVPISTSPLIPTRMDLDTPIAGSPLKQTPVMDDIKIPSRREFQNEVRHRPGEIEEKLCTNGGQLVAELDENVTETAALLSELNLDESEVSSTKAEFGDESSFLTASEFQRTGVSNMDGSFTGSFGGFDDSTVDPMTKSIGPGDFLALGNPVDLNAVHDLSDADLMVEESCPQEPANDEKLNLANVQNTEVDTKLVETEKIVTAEKEQPQESTVDLLSAEKTDNLLDSSSPVSSPRTPVVQLESRFSYGNEDNIEIEKRSFDLSASAVPEDKSTFPDFENDNTIAATENYDEETNVTSKLLEMDLEDRGSQDCGFEKCNEKWSTDYERSADIASFTGLQENVEASSTVPYNLQIESPIRERSPDIDKHTESFKELDSPRESSPIPRTTTVPDVPVLQNPLDLNVEPPVVIPPEDIVLEESSLDECCKVRAPMSPGVAVSPLDEHRSNNPFDDAKIFENAKQLEDGLLFGDVKSSDEAKPFEEIKPSDETNLLEDTKISGDAKPLEDSKPFAVDNLSEDVISFDNTKPSEEAMSFDNGKPSEDAILFNDAKPSENTILFNDAKPSEDAILFNDAKPSEEAILFNDVKPSEDDKPSETQQIDDQQTIIETGKDQFHEKEHEYDEKALEAEETTNISSGLKLSESLQEFTGLEEQLNPEKVTNGPSMMNNLIDVHTDEVKDVESVKATIAEVEQIQQPEIDSTEEKIVTKESETPKDLVEELKIEESTAKVEESAAKVEEATVVAAAAVATAAAVAGAVATVAAKSTKSKPAGKTAPKSATSARAAPTNKSTPTSPTKTTGAATRTSLSGAPKKSATGPSAARPSKLEGTGKTGTTGSPIGKTSATGVGAATGKSALGASKTSGRVSSAPAASARAKTASAVGSTKSASSVIDKKSSTSNGDTATTKSSGPGAKTSASAMPKVPSKTLVKSSTAGTRVSATATTATTVTSKTRVSSLSATATSTTTSTSNASRVTNKTSGTGTVGTTTQRPKTGPPTQGSSSLATKSRLTSSGKNPITEKQIKETANKQISSSRTSTNAIASKTTRTTVSSSTTTTSKRLSASKSTTSTTVAAAANPTIPPPIRKPTATNRPVAAKTTTLPAKTNPNKTSSTTTTKSKLVVQNGVCNAEQKIVSSTTTTTMNTLTSENNEEDVPIKDLSPVDPATDNQLIVTAD